MVKKKQGELKLLSIALFFVLRRKRSKGRREGRKEGKVVREGRKCETDYKGKEMRNRRGDRQSDR